VADPCLNSSGFCCHIEYSGNILAFGSQGGSRGKEPESWNMNADPWAPGERLSTFF
jgi:hypothetical protein